MGKQPAGDVPAGARAAEHPVGGHQDAVQHDPARGAAGNPLRLHRDTIAGRVDEEHGDAGWRRRGHQHQPGLRGGEHRGLHAGQPPARTSRPAPHSPVTFPLRTLGADRRRARVVAVLLGQRGGQDDLTAPRRGVLLLRGAEPGQGTGAEHDRGQVRHRCHGAAEFGEHAALCEQAEPGTVQRLGQGGGQDPRARQVGPQGAVEPVAGLDGAHPLRRQPAVEDLAGQVRELALGLVQREVHES